MIRYKVIQGIVYIVFSFEIRGSQIESIAGSDAGFGNTLEITTAIQI